MAKNKGSAKDNLSPETLKHSKNDKYFPPSNLLRLLGYQSPAPSPLI
jgi:hypothetical protein